jgi:membrane fusion protein (multidrug efflux system)
VHTPNLRNVTILAGLVIAVLSAGCGPKNDATAGQRKSDAAKPAPASQPVQGAAAKPSGLPVKAVTVRIGKVSDEVTAVGTLLADESVIIRSEIDGRIVGLNFQEGQAVAAGTRLVTLDNSEYEAQSAAVRADLKTEEQRLARTRELHQQNFISKDALDVQLGNVDRLKARLAEADSRVAKTQIRAPFSGTVGLRMVSPGAYVKAGEDIVRLESIGSIKADFRIPELFMSKIHTGQDVVLRLDAYPGEEFAGRVYAVEPVVDDRTRTVLMRARIPNKSNKLKPGMFVRVAVTLANRPNAIIVPEQSIWPQGRDTFVFRVIDGKAALTKIEIGNRQPGQVEVMSGLAPNDVVVTEGQIKLRDGAPVMVMPEPPAAAAPPAAAPPAQEPKKAG